jgi:glycosyltransferase involved in cell wall biosynthesis
VSTTLSAIVVVHNEEARLPACLDRLGFADELVVVLDRCTDGSRAIALAHGARLVEGAWELEGARRNEGLAACRSDWILEVDADEHVTAALAEEIRGAIAASSYDRYVIPVDNYVGERLVRGGWGGMFGKTGYTGLFRRGIKRWGMQRVHPRLELSGRAGPPLRNPIRHYVDRDVSDMVRRLDRYSSARAQDLRDSGRIGSLAGSLRSGASKFVRSYVTHKGYREGKVGLAIAICAGLYPILSHIKASELAAASEPGHGVVKSVAPE